MTVRDFLTPFARSGLSNTGAPVPLNEFQGELNKLFEDFFGQTPFALAKVSNGSRSIPDFIPPVDVKETDTTYTIAVELPGIDKKDVTVSLNDGYITIKGEKKNEVKEEKSGYFRKERTSGSFSRVIALPENADFEKAKAVTKDGVLTIEVPKTTPNISKHRVLQIEGL